MAAEDAVSPRQFFHGTEADLKPGDEIKPGNVAGHRRFSSESSGHGEFVWMTPHAHKAAWFGSRVYQVEPQGLHADYKYSTPQHHADDDARVSLAPAKVIREISSDEKLGGIA